MHRIQKIRKTKNETSVTIPWNTVLNWCQNAVWLHISVIIIYKKSLKIQNLFYWHEPILMSFQCRTISSDNLYCHNYTWNIAFSHQTLKDKPSWIFLRNHLFHQHCMYVLPWECLNVMSSCNVLPQLII